MGGLPHSDVKTRSPSPSPEDWPREIWTARQSECHLARMHGVTLPHKAKYVFRSHTPDPFLLNKVPPPPRVLPPGGLPLVPTGSGVLMLWHVVTVNNVDLSGASSGSHAGGSRQAMTCLRLSDFALSDTWALLCCIFTNKEQAVLWEAGRI